MFEVQHAVFQKIFQSPNSNRKLFYDVVSGMGGVTQVSFPGLLKFSKIFKFALGHERHHGN